MKKRSDVLRIVKNGVMELNADAKTVFPLLCPVKEDDWIDGWADVCTIVYTDSGIAEEACVFETDIPGEGRALWICSKYDAANTEIEYIKHLIGKAIIKWRMAVRDLPDGKSKIEAVYNATGMGKEGTVYVKMLADKGIKELFRGLETQINYYIAHGEKIKRNLAEKAALHIHGHHSGK
jgi:hypothetical protein